MLTGRFFLRKERLALNPEMEKKLSQSTVAVPSSTLHSQ
jgi:hypothetical protein